MSRLDGQHVLVVGATGGLGSAIARELGSRRTTLTLTARSDAALQDLAGGLAPAARGVIVADLADPAAAATMLEAARKHGGRLDGVVFAAGVVAFGEVRDLADDVLDRLIAINLLAPIRLAREAAYALDEGGFIAQISAIVAEQPTRAMAAYSAAKAGLSAFDQALGPELRRHHIRVLDVRPPHTETGLADRPIAGSSPRLPRGLDPAAVARRIVDAIESDESDLPSSAFGDAR